MTLLKRILNFGCLILFFTGFAYASGVQNIDNKELKQLMEQNVTVVDVRTTTEWKKTGVIEGSHLIMFYDEKGKYDLDAWLGEVASVAKKDEPLVLICHSGGRTKQLANYLAKERGYEKVYNVKKGIVHWIKKDNPTVSIQ
ncbi:MAG: rhodanese-like domain-containing protein [Gammaproteobacteria bacterium]